ncbi:hypothetical protein AX774_g878 [Zancudomyces culisetae]|uniref:Uncharacterized protein n=1 Tax=Zancudomyces culisetae TaxID=1213189 RepID=A0A1R1PX74_ZANCU|nr:hypothetical protein AX774_g878 [Zancudomyces culisetae]|eukprot:OMH85590.1 hypothetical protein AX774_g878 [Zancudomyces culisetae]
MNASNLNKFREQVLADDTLEEKVEVNQRHLIDKILARLVFEAPNSSSGADFATMSFVVEYMYMYAVDTYFTNVINQLEKKNNYRYSAEFTIYRELLQNANDAEASEVKIIFHTKNNGEDSISEYSDAEEVIDTAVDETQDQGPEVMGLEGIYKTAAEKKTKLNEQYTSVSVCNNGRSFSSEDWKRLKKIAEGNPDEQKVK